MELKSIILYVPVFVFIIVLHVVWARYRIKQWALHNGYTILKCKICLFNIGPFSYFGTSGSQSVFKIIAVNQEGKTRTGFARAGGFFFGLIRKRVEVKWDKSLIDE